MMRTNFSRMSNKKRKSSEADIDIGALLNTIGGGGNSDMPSISRALGDDPDTKLYVRDNNIYFQDEINFDTASALIKVMTDTAIELKFMQKQFGLKEVPSIKLYITSPGGIVLSAYMIIDAMKSCEVPVDTIISGFAASAATIISIHGARRFMQKNAVMLIHQASSTMWSRFTMEEIKDNYVNMTQMSDKIREMYASNTTMTKTQLKEILKHDLDWDSSECLRRGLVDEIL